MERDPELFSFEHVAVAGRGDRTRLRDADGVVPPTGVTVVVGPSGAGKSTLLRLCNRLEVPSSGVVRHRGDDVATLDPLELRRRVGMVFQRPTPFAGSVFDNLHVAQPDLSHADAVSALERVRLAATFMDLPATELSGGEAQRVCLARTLVTRPDVVLMDEPASSVDPTTKRALEQLARALAESGTAIVWVTHDLEQMRRIADHVLIVIDGSIAHAAPVAELDTNAPPSVQRFLAEEAA